MRTFNKCIFHVLSSGRRSFQHHEIVLLRKRRIRVSERADSRDKATTKRILSGAPQAPQGHRKLVYCKNVEETNLITKKQSTLIF